MARSPADALSPDRPLTLAGVADGAEGLIAADLARAVAAKAGAAPTSLLVVCRDGQRLAQLARGLGFFAPDVAIEQFPAWDCLAHDRQRRAPAGARAQARCRAGALRRARQHAPDGERGRLARAQRLCPHVDR